MKIYVAGMYDAAAEVRAAQALVCAAGHVITYDWTVNHIPADTDPATIRKLRQQFADLDLEGVKTADVVVALFTNPCYPYRGTFTEIGCALGLGKCVMAVCPDYCRYLESGNEEPAYATNCFFNASRVVHCPSVEAVLPLLAA